MKKIYILLLGISLCTLQQGFAQKYITRTGITEFKASEKTFEPIEAVNKSTTVILKADTGDIAAQLFIAAFEFKVALMQEHFNENYMDSYQYPKATFRGRLVDFSLENIQDKNTFVLEGNITIKGITKTITTEATIHKTQEGLHLQSSFIVTPQDFEISIPSIVRNKIAKEIEISIDYVFTEKK